MIKLLTISQKFGVDFFMSSDTSTLSHDKIAKHFTKELTIDYIFECCCMLFKLHVRQRKYNYS